MKADMAHLLIRHREGRLSEAEEAALVRAALHDQELFDALGAVEFLREQCPRPATAVVAVPSRGFRLILAFSGAVVALIIAISFWGPDLRSKPTVTPAFDPAGVGQAVAPKDILAGGKLSPPYGFHYAGSPQDVVRHQTLTEGGQSFIRMEYSGGSLAAGAALFITAGGDARAKPRPSEDFSAYEAMVLDVRGKNGGERLLFGFKTNNDPDNGLEPRVIVERSAGRGLTRDWDRYTIPLDSRFDYKGMPARDRLEKIHTLAEFVFGGSAPQTVDVRLMSFGPSRLDPVKAFQLEPRNTGALTVAFNHEGLRPAYHPGDEFRLDITSGRPGELYVFERPDNGAPSLFSNQLQPFPVRKGENIGVVPGMRVGVRLGARRVRVVLLPAGNGLDNAEVIELEYDVRRPGE